MGVTTTVTVLTLVAEELSCLYVRPSHYVAQTDNLNSIIYKLIWDL